MKNFIILSMLFVSFNTLAGTYSCESTQARQTGTKLLTFGTLDIVENKENGLRTLLVNGKLAVDYAYSITESTPEYCYQASFSDVALVEKETYKPQVYKGYSKFEDFDATTTSRCDGGGMYGYLVVEKDTTKKKVFTAHYVFQAGDHIGGTIDFLCTKK